MICIPIKRAHCEIKLDSCRIMDLDELMEESDVIEAPCEALSGHIIEESKPNSLLRPGSMGE